MLGKAFRNHMILLYTRINLAPKDRDILRFAYIYMHIYMHNHIKLRIQ